MKTSYATAFFSLVFFSLLSIGSFREATAQSCQPPLKQVILYDPSGNFYVYWKPAIMMGVVDYKVTIKCTNLPPCNITVFVNNSNVIKMNGGFLGVKIPALPGINSTVVASIFKPSCDQVFSPIFMFALDIITDDLSIATASCDSDTCEIFLNSWTKLKELTDYANNVCGGSVGPASPTTVTCVDAPLEIRLRKNAAGKWQIRTLDTLKCDTCYVFNFQVKCTDGTVNYVQDTVCFNYTGVDIGCKLLTEDPSSGELKVFPNPAGEKATLEFYLMNAGLVTVTVRNALGQVVPAGNVSQKLENGKNQIVIPTEHLSSGMYFVTINAGDLTLRGKLIK